jgi:hypothetical protein
MTYEIKHLKQSNTKGTIYKIIHLKQSNIKGTAHVTSKVFGVGEMVERDVLQTFAETQGYCYCLLGDKIYLVPNNGTEVRTMESFIQFLEAAHLIAVLSL